MHNGVSLDLVIPTHADANMTMYTNKESFDVIDLDPYGSASPFLDGALFSIKDGGLLCVTCTDMAVLCGSYSEACFAKYNSMSLKGESCHEMALRIILSSIETAAAKYKKYIIPLVSCSIDFYARVFVIVKKSALQTKFTASKRSMVVQCSTCKSFQLQPLGKATSQNKFSPATLQVEPKCTICGSVNHVGGPIWNKNIHEVSFVKKLINLIKEKGDAFGTKARMLGMMTVISEEIDTPLVWSPSFMGNVLHSVTPSLIQFNSALLNAGFKVSATHTNPLCIKTDAPPLFIWDIMRSWVKMNPIKMENIGDHSPSRKILSVEAVNVVSFERHPESNPPSRQIKLVRFQENPEKNWGPKPRAKKLKQDNKSE